MALFRAIATTLVNVDSFKFSRMQFLPGNVLWVEPERNETSLWRALLMRIVALRSSIFQTLTWRTPTVTSLFPIHAIRLMWLTHLLLACSVAAPVRELMCQMYKKPSLAEPKLARKRESGLKATQLTPKV